MTYQNDETVPVPRNRLFVLKDGRFVIQWEENRVQDLLSGRYSTFVADDFANAITDYELNQLMNSGIVAHYDDEHIHLQPDVNGTYNTGRSYYLNTTLHKSQVNAVRDALQANPATAQFSVRVQGIFVIIRAAAGTAFHDFEATERARETITEQLPDLLGNTVVAFVEIIAAP